MVKSRGGCVSSWDEALSRVVELNKSVRPTEAQELLAEIITDCPESEFREIEAHIADTIATFLPKRRRSLKDVLEVRQRTRVAVPARPATLVPVTEQPAPPRPSGAPLPSPAAELIKPAVGERGPEIRVELAAIEQLNRTVQPALAEARFRDLVRSMDPAEVRRHSADLTTCASGFLPKRCRALTALLESMLHQPEQDDREPAATTDAAPDLVDWPGAGASAPERVLSPVPGPVPATTQAGTTVAAHENRANTPLTYSRNRLSEDLDDLGRRHIFQWATFYRDTLSQYFDDFLVELESSDKPGQWLNLVKAGLSHHSTDIYQRGYRYQLERNAASSHYAITKSLAGLQRFLDLPLEFYSARLSSVDRSGATLPLRQLCSAMVSGILIGYSNARFDTAGSNILPRFPGSWVHVLPFLTSEDLRELMDNLQPGDLLDGLQDSMSPFVRALDVLLSKHPDGAPLPALSQYTDGNRRLEVSLHVASNTLGPRRIEVHCYTSARFVDKVLIEEAAGRAVGAVIAPLRADLRVQLLSAERLSDIIVPTGDSATAEEPHTRLVALLEDLVYETRASSGQRPIEFNFAADFRWRARS